ncbi:MAG: ATP-binding protein [Thermoanaerobaculia bacterium]
MSELLRPRRLATLLLLAITAGLAVVGARGFEQKLETFQPLGFQAAAATDHWEVRAVDPQFESTLEVGDRIVLVNGAEASRVPRLSSALRDAPTAQLVVLRQDRLETVEYQRPPLDLNAPYLILAFIGCAYAAIGLFVIWRSGSAAGGLLFYLWCLASAVLYVFSPVFPADGLGRWIYFFDEAARLLLPPLTLQLFLSIPRPAAAERRRWMPFLYLPAAVLTLFQADLAWANGNFLVGAPSPRMLVVLDRIELAHLLLFAALSVVVLARRLAALREWEQQRQLLWLLVGMAAGYLPFFLFNGLPSLLGLELPESLSALAVLPLACVPFAFAWAVLRYRLWDLGIMVRNGLAYTLTLIFGLTTFSLIDLAVRRTMPVGLGFTRDLLTFIGGILAVGLVVPTHRGIHGALERLQYGRAFGHRRGLQRVAQDLLQERDLDRLCQALLSEVEQALDLERGNLLLLQGPALVPVRPHAGLPRAVALATLRDGLWEGEFETLSPIGLPGESATAEQQLYVAGYRYAFPLRVRGQKIGLTLASLRSDGQPLSTEDVDIVRTLLDQAALAIENAQLLDQVHRQLARVTSLQRHNEEILESSPAGIVVLDAEGIVASANLAFAAIAGRPRGELIGRQLLDLFPLEAVPEPGSGIRQLSFSDSGGAERHLQLTAAPLSAELADAADTADGSGAAGRRRPDRVLVVQDVSERVAMERALREQDRLASLGVLAAGVAHEVNTPLTGISSYAQMLLADTDASDPRRELLQKVERQTFRASRIVNGLLEFARKRDHESGPVALPALLAETVDLLRERLQARSVTVDWKLPEQTPDVSGSEGELQQVFTNLLLNAIDAAPERGGRIEIGMEKAPVPAGAGATAGVRVRIGDNGSGIEAQHLAKVFEPFYTTKTGKGGTGLGLAISRSIVEQHGGRILVESQGRDLGCQFIVDLPTSGNASPSTPPASPETARERA